MRYLDKLFKIQSSWIFVSCCSIKKKKVNIFFYYSMNANIFYDHSEDTKLLYNKPCVVNNSCSVRYQSLYLTEPWIDILLRPSFFFFFSRIFFFKKRERKERWYCLKIAMTLYYTKYGFSWSSKFVIHFLLFPLLFSLSLIG